MERRLLYAAQNIFKKITQIYGLFLNRLSFLEKKLFCFPNLPFCNKIVVFSFPYIKVFSNEIYLL